MYKYIPRKRDYIILCALFMFIHTAIVLNCDLLPLFHIYMYIIIYIVTNISYFITYHYIMCTCTLIQYIIYFRYMQCWSMRIPFTRVIIGRLIKIIVFLFHLLSLLLI